MKMTVPIEGTGVKQGVSYSRDGNGNPVVDTNSMPVSESQTTEQVGVELNNLISEESSPMQQFHKDLDPSKVTFSFDESTGRVRVIPKESVSQEADISEETDFPEPQEQHQTIPGGSESQNLKNLTANSEVAELKDQLSQMTQVITAMAQAQLTGKPLAEIAGIQTQVEPNYDDLDLNDPRVLSSFIKQQVGSAVQGVMGQFQPTIDASKRRMEYDTTVAKFGSDPAFQQKIIPALQLVQNNPSLSIEQGYGMVQSIASSLGNNTNNQNGNQKPVNSTTRTITKEQAEQKAAQAKRLPSNSGVRGAGNANPPDHVKGLGQLIAWNLQQASGG